MFLSKPSSNQWFLYILRCNNGSLYTGITKDIERRFEEHQSQGKKCSKYLRGKAPLTIVYQSSPLSHEEALKQEMCIKRFSKKEKEEFIKRYNNYRHGDNLEKIF